MTTQPALDRRRRRRAPEDAQDVTAAENVERDEEIERTASRRAARNEHDDTPLRTLDVQVKQRSEAGVDKINNDPIAVIDAGGHIFPFAANRVSRHYLMMANVTYIWTREELMKAIEHNEKMIAQRAFDRIAIGDILPAKTIDDMSTHEVQAAVFNPTMLQGLS